MLLDLRTLTNGAILKYFVGGLDGLSPDQIVFIEGCLCLDFLDEGLLVNGRVP